MHGAGGMDVKFTQREGYAYPSVLGCRNIYFHMKLLKVDRDE